MITSLYYPHININQDWLRQAVLYSEKVSSILPFWEGEQLSDDIHYLHQKEIYTPKFASDIIKNCSDEQRTHFEETFIDTINGEYFIQDKIKRPAFSADAYSIYIEKIPSKVLDHLANSKLIKKESNRAIVTDKNIALTYMAMLSDFISAVSKETIIPSTDIQDFEKLAFQSASKKIKAHRLVLQECLPVPNETVSIKQLVKFREEHGSQFRNFMQEISKLEQDLLKCNEDRERQDKINEITFNIKAKILDLKDCYKGSKIDFTFKSLSSLLDLKAKDGLIISGAVAAHTILHVPIPIVVGISASLWIASTHTNYKKAKTDLQAKPYSYLYDARNKGIVL